VLSKWQAGALATEPQTSRSGQPWRGWGFVGPKADVVTLCQLATYRHRRFWRADCITLLPTHPWVRRIGSRASRLGCRVPSECDPPGGLACGPWPDEPTVAGSQEAPNPGCGRRPLRTAAGMADRRKQPSIWQTPWIAELPSVGHRRGEDTISPGPHPNPAWRREYGQEERSQVNQFQPEDSTLGRSSAGRT